MQDSATPASSASSPLEASSSSPAQHRALHAVLLAAGLAVAAFLLVALGTRVLGLPPLGALLDPADGLYRTARRATHAGGQSLSIPGLTAPVEVLRDDRGVPHIFARSDRDAIMAMGYLVARDRLFQLDFLPRVAAGRLSEALGPTLVDTDRFLRSTGMAWGARKNAARIEAQGGLERDLLSWYTSGVNAYLDGLDEGDVPFEFRLLGYHPERWTPLQSLLVLQYMAYDLSYRTDDADYGRLAAALGPDDYRFLFPRYADIYVPIIPELGGGVLRTGGDMAGPTGPTLPPALESSVLTAASRPMERHDATRAGLSGTLAEGFIEGKGSNNWAVGPDRSATGAPILAGDMHLALSLPSIWYEVHLVTPTMNVYGVTIPGSPLPVEAFNHHLAWAFTNTGADVVDHYALTLDATGTRYAYDDTYRELLFVPDTVHVLGGAPVVDTLRYAHWGPVIEDAGTAVALRWTAHDSSRTVAALYGMNRATRCAGDFQEALRRWDTPVQNILCADTDGTISIRSTGYLPIRRAGHGAGLLDGTSDLFAWTGRVDFDELPHSTNPGRGYLFSANQQPADPLYPHYLGHDWRAAYRSLRIDTLLSRQEHHSVDDFKRYQADVHAVQRDLFVPLLDTLSGLSPRADSLRALLARWDGQTTTDRPEPLAMDEFLAALKELAWDEEVFRIREPNETRLYLLLRDQPASPWLDVEATAARETGPALLRTALEAAAEHLEAEYGSDLAGWRWGDHHGVVFRHLLRTDILRALSRGPVEYPGFRATVSPASGRPTTHSASWRVVVDLSASPPRGYGIYPGGQSGNPLSPLYDLHLPAYVSFEHYDLLKPNTPLDLDPARLNTRLRLVPGR